ncbi:Transposon Ty3-G Gag-Pol polyprotein [Labeo rohita]|uniref:ribonuclease H n=1 Tax=Labeo rohita TaxID=84645 RepID=A0ABQ8MKC5_LABRO|nr:Transposon Ty3-G Gag-Pol polyprotein [Labeo rohita]
MSKKALVKSGSSDKSGPRYRLCVPPCKRYITSGDTHSMCVVCLGAEHAASALEGADCPHCEELPLRTLRSRKDLFEEGSFISVPQGAGPASAEAERALHSWGSQLDLLEGMETGNPLSPSSPSRSAARSVGSEARSAATSSQGAGSSLLLSSSGEGDLESVCEPLPQSPQYEELLEVVTRAVAKLNISWPAEEELTPQRSKLDERFLRSKNPPPRRSLPFFPDLHDEISRSWARPFSARLFVPASDYYGNVVGLDERAYKAMPRVEQTLASYLSPGEASSLKAPTLPSKPLRKKWGGLWQPWWRRRGICGTRRHANKRRRSRSSSLAVRWLMWLLGVSSHNRVPAPRTVRFKSLVLPRPGAETRGTLDRGALRRGPTCGSCFRRRGPRPKSGPDANSGPPRVAPAGGGWVLPHYTVPISPRCPRGVSLTFLPRLQNTAASDERMPWVFPPGLVAEPGRSSPPRGSLEQLVRQSPAGPPLQVSELAVQSTPEASLERLVPLVDYLAAWKLLPNVSAWVLRTVEEGYTIQFGAPPPPFDGVFPTVVGPEQALVMELEVVTLLRKEAIEVVPPHVRESGFYSRYFIVPKKDGGLRPILDLRRLNHSVMKLKFKMLTIKQVISQIRSEDWFVTIDLKDAYFHVSILPQHRKFLRFAFRGEAYQYRVLPFGPALSPRTFTKCVDAALVPLRLQGIRILNYIDDWLILAASESLAVQHRDVVLAHMKALGLRLNAKKSVLSPSQRTTYLGVVWDSTTMQARLSPARIESILAAVRRVKEGRSLTVKQFQQLLGLMAAASNVIPFGLLYMRPLQWWLKTKGFSRRGKPAPHDQGYAPRATYLRYVEETLVPKSGPGVGSSLPPCLTSDGCIPHRLGGGHEWPLRPGSVEWSPSQLAHQLPRDAGRISSSEVLSSRPERSPCASTHRQHSRGLLHQPPGRPAFAPLIQAGAPDPCVVPGQTPLTASSSYSWVSKCGSRHPVEAGAEAREWMLHPEVVKQIWRIFGSAQVDLFATRENAQCPLWFSLVHPAPLGLDAMTQTWPRLRLSSGESAPGRSQSTVSSPALAGPSMVLGPDISPRRLSMGDSRQEGSPLTGGGYHLAPPPGAMEAVGVASEGAQLIASGLSTKVVETILQSRAPSTRKLYALKWKLFTSWCGERQQDPANCPVGTVLEFLQARLSTGLAHSTLKVYVAAILAYHAPLGGMSVGRNPLVTRFLRGALRLRPPTRPHIPTWDLAVVLEALCRPPFEPIEDISDHLLTIKTALLLALTSLKRVGDLQALSVAPSHLEFAPGMTKAFLYPRPGYVPKVPTSTPQPVVLQAFCPPPFREPNQQKQNCVCPVRALDAYVHRAALWRKSEQLFVCYGPPKKGSPASKQTISRWIVDAISTSYVSSDLPSPMGLRAHSTRATAASKALMLGVPIQDICNAAGWSTPLTFVRFYSLDTRATPGSSVLRLPTQLEFPKGNVPGYVCNHGSPRERDAASRSILLASLPSARFILEADAGRLRTCFYASWSVTSPARDVLLSHWSDFTCVQSVVPPKAFP